MYLRKLLDAFTEKTKEKMLENDYFGIYFAVQKIILDCTEEFHLKTRAFLTDKMTHELKDGQKIIDVFRECPNCKEIWLKVQGCNDATCGNRPHNKWDFRIDEQKFRYRILYDGMKKVIVSQLGEVSSNPLKLPSAKSAAQVRRILGYSSKP